MGLTDASVLEKKLKYQVSHPLEETNSWTEWLSPRTTLHRMGWMKVMVTADDAKEVFGKAFSRPPRLLFTNPVCIMFSLYYAYIYGEWRLDMADEPDIDSQPLSTSS